MRFDNYWKVFPLTQHIICVRPITTEIKRVESMVYIRYHPTKTNYSRGDIEIVGNDKEKGNEENGKD